MSVISKKICLLGDIAVGKTSLIRRYVEREFKKQYFSTIGGKISRKTMVLGGVNQYKSLNLQLLIWDLESNMKFTELASGYLQGASGAIIVADVLRQGTIERLIEYVYLFLAINPKGFVMIALNKTDLLPKEQLDIIISYIESKKLPRVIGVYETSAKDGINVDKVFNSLAYQIINAENKSLVTSAR